MPPKRAFSLLGTQRQRANRLEDLEPMVAVSLCERYRAKLQPNGSILLVPADYSKATDITPDSHGATSAQLTELSRSGSR